MTITTTGKTQDEALENAKKVAAEKGFRQVSLKNIISITYEAELYDPIPEDQAAPEVKEEKTE